eukprot:scaffold6007_cov183-Amphora_coffeaeformis.AAC.34
MVSEHIAQGRTTSMHPYAHNTLTCRCRMTRHGKHKGILCDNGMQDPTYQILIRIPKQAILAI